MGVTGPQVLNAHQAIPAAIATVRWPPGALHAPGGSLEPVAAAVGTILVRAITPALLPSYGG